MAPRFELHHLDFRGLDVAHYSMLILFNCSSSARAPHSVVIYYFMEKIEVIRGALPYMSAFAFPFTKLPRFTLMLILSLRG